MSLTININYFLSVLQLKKKNLKQKNHLTNINNNCSYYFVKFIINITIKKLKIFVHILNCFGDELLFFSIPNKIKKLNDNLEHLYKIIIKKFKFFKNYPIAIHFNNISFNYKFILLKLSKHFFIVNIKIFNKYAYNGCRIKK